MGRLGAGVCAADVDAKITDTATAINRETPRPGCVATFSLLCVDAANYIRAELVERVEAARASISFLQD